MSEICKVMVSAQKNLVIYLQIAKCLLLPFSHISGRYLYAEASGKSKNDSAALASATIGPTSTFRYASKPCMMSFWYHMRGSRIGSLNVYQATNYGSMDNLVWAKSGDQGSRWVKGVVSLTSDKDFQIIIQAKMGVSFQGDIAIDDVIFSPECVFNGNQLPGEFKRVKYTLLL